MNMKTISQWSAMRWPWGLLLISALGLELTALFFQYSMKLEPCVMCIYQRTAVLGILLSAVPALYNPTSVLNRIASYTLWGVSAIWGLLIAYEHVQMQNPDNIMLLLSCDVFPNFPSWLPLHELIPAFFEPRGTCGDIDWQFVGMSMPQWMVVIFGLYSVLFAVVLAARFIKNKSL
jgi:disulfide bond formation protein DsbB